MALIAEQDQRVPSLLTIQDINASMADVTLELIARNYCFCLLSR